MEAGLIAVTAIAIGLGVIIGIFLGQSLANRRYVRETQYTQGTLNVDCSDPEFDPGLFLGLAIPVENVTMRKYITLDVNVISQNSQK